MLKFAECIALGRPVGQEARPLPSYGAVIAYSILHGSLPLDY